MRRLVISISLLALATTAAATEERFLVRVDKGFESLEGLCERLGVRFVERIRDDGDELYAVVSSDLPRDVARKLLESESAIRGVEAVERLRLSEAEDGEGREESFSLARRHAARAFKGDLAEGGRLDYHGSPALPAYLRQPAAQGLSLKRVHRRLGTGVGTVAVIDTGVDPHHPLLRPVLVAGFDFLNREAGIPSEWRDLDAGTAARLEQSTVAVLDSRDLAILNQSTVAVLDSKTADRLARPEYRAFGHGTMVAGLIRLVAPTARIMPLKAFRADGTADTADVAEAIYYAVDHGADVINMSFSFQVFSSEVMRALNYATRNGVVAIAASGNTGEPILVFPASLINVTGVAATDVSGKRSTISNYGVDVVGLGAQGEELVTSYPGGAYAVGFGTSFSAALVSGAATILGAVDAAAGPHRIQEALGMGRVPEHELGHGRLDIEGAAQWLRRERRGKDDDDDDE